MKFGGYVDGSDLIPGVMRTRDGIEMIRVATCGTVRAGRRECGMFVKPGPGFYLAVLAAHGEMMVCVVEQTQRVSVRDCLRCYFTNTKKWLQF